MNSTLPNNSFVYIVCLGTHPSSVTWLNGRTKAETVNLDWQPGSLGNNLSGTMWQMSTNSESIVIFKNLGTDQDNIQHYLGAGGQGGGRVFLSSALGAETKWEISPVIARDYWPAQPWALNNGVNNSNMTVALKSVATGSYLNGETANGGVGLVDKPEDYSGAHWIILNAPVWS